MDITNVTDLEKLNMERGWFRLCHEEMLGEGSRLHKSPPSCTHHYPQMGRKL